MAALEKLALDLDINQIDEVIGGYAITCTETFIGGHTVIVCTTEIFDGQF